MITDEQKTTYMLLVNQAARAEMRAEELRGLARDLAYLKRKLAKNEALRIDQQARIIELTSACPRCEHL